ncbi:hypothetical protein H8356DRAFT_1661292 [Neocallimastix lanati (nom. inval.)]|nr:hypothetical protein H8356DRAFT_1661292 [Neocallimastix sp. JGI-2020a]
MVSTEEIEIKEAIASADRALAKLERANKALRSAKNWGTYDTFFGGGFISSMQKHDKIKESKGYIEGAKKAIQELSVQVKDVPTIKIDGFLEFTDIFMDNVFSDFKVQSKITKTKDNCKRAIDEVRTIKKELEDRLAVLNEQKI